MKKKYFTKNNLLKLVVAAVILFLLIQVIPLGRDHANPPIVSEPQWDSPATRALFKRACFDCHSNETVWPWYANIAPMSWLVQMDVNNGRSEMNFSEWDKYQRINADLIAYQVTNDKMPLPQYLMLHPEARLTQAEKDQLVQGIRATLAQP